MTKKQQALIDGFIELLPGDCKRAYGEIINFLAGLGYIPQKQRVKDEIISFKHKDSGRVISKMGIRNNKAFLSVRFFACAEVSDRYLDALRDEIISRNRQYASSLMNIPDTGSNVKYKCGYCGDICTGGGYGYYYKFSDNDIVSRCGAYPIVIPGFNENDVDGLKQMIMEQNDFFMSIAKQGSSLRA